MVEHELLMLAIEERFPDLVHGRDYWVGHPLDPKTGLHAGDAFIAEWKCATKQPNIAGLLARAEELRPVLTAEKTRARRDSLLAASDWTQAPDVPPGVREKWTAYRSALRDLPNQPGFPMDVEWPASPL